MDFWQLYLLTIVPDICTKLGPLPIMGMGMGTMGCIGATFMKADSDIPKEVITSIIRLSKKSIVFGILTGIIVLACPSKESLYTIMGGYYVTHIEGIDKLPPNVVGAMNKFLEKYEDGNSNGKKEDKGV